MKKYRIKIVEKNNGEKFYIPHFRKWFFWYRIYRKIVYLSNEKSSRIYLSYYKDNLEKYSEIETYSKIEEAQDLIEKYKCQLENDLIKKYNNKTKSVKNKYI